MRGLITLSAGALAALQRSHGRAQSESIWTNRVKHGGSGNIFAVSVGSYSDSHKERQGGEKEAFRQVWTAFQTFQRFQEVGTLRGNESSGSDSGGFLLPRHTNETTAARPIRPITVALMADFKRSHAPKWKEEYLPWFQKTYVPELEQWFAKNKYGIDETFRLSVDYVSLNGKPRRGNAEYTVF